MSSDGVMELLCSKRVIPVAAFAELDTVLPVAEALEAGGLPVVEVTFRTPVAAGCSSSARCRRPHARRSGDDRPSGSGRPGTRRRGAVHRLARLQLTGRRALPGGRPSCLARRGDRHRRDGSTRPRDRSAEALPAEASGGLDLLRALRGPFPEVRFVPTGGVSSANAAAYLGMPSVAAIGGSWMVAPSSWPRATSRRSPV